MLPVVQAPPRHSGATATAGIFVITHLFVAHHEPNLAHIELQQEAQQGQRLHPVDSVEWQSIRSTKVVCVGLAVLQFMKARNAQHTLARPAPPCAASPDPAQNRHHQPCRPSPPSLPCHALPHTAQCPSAPARPAPPRLSRPALPYLSPPRPTLLRTLRKRGADQRVGMLGCVGNSLASAKPWPPR